jgi:hypothetical protein
LDKFNDSNQDQVIYELFSGTNDNNDLISNAEQILFQIDKSSKQNQNLDMVEKYIDSFNIEYNFDYFNNSINNLCKMSEPHNFTNHISPTHKFKSSVQLFSQNEDSIKLTNEINNINLIPINTINTPHDNSFPNTSSTSNNIIINANNANDSSFMSLCEEALHSFNLNKHSSNNKILLESNQNLSFVSDNFLGKTINLPLQQLNKPLTNDKIVFIKNQLKNEIANFSGYAIGDEGAKKVSEFLLSNQFSSSPSKRNLTSKIKELKLSKSSIGDEGFAHLSHCLEKNNSISTINLSKNRLKDESMNNLLNLIKNNKNIKSLNIQGNQFSQGIKEKIKTASKNLNSQMKLEI